eukprot:760859-Hanusia_phi.AAC.1
MRTNSCQPGLTGTAGELLAGKKLEIDGSGDEGLACLTPSGPAALQLPGKPWQESSPCIRSTCPPESVPVSLVPCRCAERMASKETTEMDDLPASQE